MFIFDSYAEAHRVKSDVSRLLLGKNENVVSVATEEQSINGTIKYCVRVGLKKNTDIEISKIFAMLSAEKLVSGFLAQSPDFYRVFRREGRIIAHQVAQPSPFFINLTRFFSKNHLPLA